MLLNHAHDTLCGTSIDAVASAFDHRIARACEQAVGLREEALHALSGHDTELARADIASWRPVVMLRNPVPRVRSGVAEIRLTATLSDVAVGPGSADRQGAPRALARWEVDGVPIQRLATSERIELTEAPRAYPDADRVVAVCALGWVEAMAGYSVVTHAMTGSTETKIPQPVRAEALTLDNGLLRVECDASGSVRITDLATGRHVQALVALERTREAGDLYTPAVRETLRPPHVRSVRPGAPGPLRGEIVLDAEYDDQGRSGGDCRLTLQLDAGLAALRVVVQGDNRTEDHRLRIRFASGLPGSSTLADAAFHTMAREPIRVTEDDERMEHAVPTAPLHRWVSRYGRQAGFTLFSDGLAEYESDADGSIAITLLRAVGSLSRHDLPERPGHAGWPADVPRAQSIGPFGARFALARPGPDSPTERDRIERLADDVLLPIVGETLRSNLREPHAAGGLTLDGQGLVLSAIAPAACDGWIVLRCVNRGDSPQHGRWTLRRPVSEAVQARLDETAVRPIEVRDGAIDFEAAPHEIVTILAR